MSVVPYLTISGGRGGAATDFYKSLFGATETMRMPSEDGKRVLHVALEFHGGNLYLSDDFSDQKHEPAMSSVFVRLEEPADVDAVAAKAKGLGATITRQPEDMFWGDRYAQFTDPFGHHWQIGATKS